VRYAQRHGLACPAPHEVLDRYREAYNTPWGQSSLRYVGDGRPFWRHIVAHALGVDHEGAFEDIYEYYARGEAWAVSPGAVDALRRIRGRLGLKLAVVSNFDTRLRRILAELGLDDVFDAVVVSAEVGAEKPNPRLFEAACEALGVAPERAVHVGDDRRNDLFGARDAGCYAFLYGQDVHHFMDVERRLETNNYIDDL
jgi:REG-2-like HAD superfamily hydrolase